MKKLSRIFVSLILLGAVFIAPNLAYAAVGLDTPTSGAAARNAGALTLAHTCTGLNMTLVVGINTTGGTAVPSAVTYNGSAMTIVSGSTATNGNRISSIWYQIIGAGDGISHNIQITAGAANGLVAGAICFSGTAASPIGASNNAIGTSVAPRNTLTSTIANSVLFEADTANNTIAGLSPISVFGTTVSQWQTNTDATTGSSQLGSTLTTTSIASYTIGWTTTASDGWASSALEVLPLASTAVAPPSDLLVDAGWIS